MRILIQERKKVYDAFMDLTKSLNDGGILTQRERELVLIGSVTTDRSPYGVALHTKRALEAGATKEEIVQAIISCLPVSGIGSINQALETAMNVVEAQKTPPRT
jgi:AhpD family alkylhydroperoxidase